MDGEGAALTKIAMSRFSKIASTSSPWCKSGRGPDALGRVWPFHQHLNT
jgi:hypothetical protein